VLRRASAASEAEVASELGVRLLGAEAIGGGRVGSESLVGIMLLQPKEVAVRFGRTDDFLREDELGGPEVLAHMPGRIKFFSWPDTKFDLRPLADRLRALLEARGCEPGQLQERSVR
jgi:hypothetical protein